MRLDGIHHVTAITASAQPNVDHYARLLGLRLVKTTVNFDAPEMYHLYFGDETGSPGSILTFFEIPGARPGRAGVGMVHRVVFRVATEAALDFWATRLGDDGRPVERHDDGLVTADPEGLSLGIVVGERADGGARAAWHPEIPAAHALGGIVGVRAHSASPADTERLMVDALGFTRQGHALVTVGPERRGHYWMDPAPTAPGIPGAGTVHHVAWTSLDAEHAAWGPAVAAAGAHPTGIIDRQYFHSIYFREPGRVLFEIATVSPGFAVDEEPARIGEELRLPPRYEPHRAAIAARLTPLRNPRAGIDPAPHEPEAP